MSAADDVGGDVEDRLDELVAEYSDLVSAGRAPSREEFLARGPMEARAGLERCLKMIEAGLASAPTAATHLAPGLVLGRYELRSELGRGGMALVWLAQDRELRRPVALKLLRPGLALEGAHVDRFRREALAIARLRHPSIVQVHDVGSAQGFHYLAMEFVEGPSLARVLEALGPTSDRRWTSEELARAAGVPAIARRGRTLEQALAALLAPVADALAVAHDAGIVHRDVKPSNILIRADGTPVVADFGLAKSEGDLALSMTGDTLGTPYYMSPEQAWLSEIRVDHRTDLYSLGVCLYEALTGARPFEGRNALEVFERIKSAHLPAPDRVEARVSRDASAVVRRAMARDPEQRYADAPSFGADLVALAEGLPTRARRDQGGPLRRAWASWRLFTSGQPFEYRSHAELLGWPLVHLVNGRRAPGAARRVARGWLAWSAEDAVGVLAMGERAVGVVACGGLTCGLLFSFGGMAVGLVSSCGGLALAAFPFGGCSLGYVAVGGAAIGYVAIGGWARGVYALGANAQGVHVVSQTAPGLAREQWFEAAAPWLHHMAQWLGWV